MKKVKVHPQFEETLKWVRVKRRELLNADDAEIQKYSTIMSTFPDIEKMIIAIELIDKMGDDDLKNKKLRPLIATFVALLPTISDFFGAAWYSTYERQKMDKERESLKPKKVLVDNNPLNASMNITLNRKYEDDYNRFQRQYKEWLVKYEKISSSKEYQYALFLLDYLTDGKREVDINEDTDGMVSYLLSTIYTSISEHRLESSKNIQSLNLVADRLEVYSYKNWCRRFVLEEFLEE